MAKGYIYMVTELGRRTVKVGFTKNLEQRKKFYRTHNTSAVFFDVREGTMQDEKYCHLYLEAMGFEKVFPNEAKSEWYKIPKGMKKDELLAQGFAFFNFLAK